MLKSTDSRIISIMLNTYSRAVAIQAESIYTQLNGHEDFDYALVKAKLAKLEEYTRKFRAELKRSLV